MIMVKLVLGRIYQCLDMGVAGQKGWETLI